MSDGLAQNAPDQGDHSVASRLMDRLVTHPLFADLEPAQIRALLDDSTVRSVPAQTDLFQEGTPAASFFLLIDGFVRLQRTTSDGDQVVVLHVAPGGLLGIAKAIETDTYPWTARAASDVTVLSWPSDVWEHFADTLPGFLPTTRRTLGLRLGEMRDNIVEMATYKVEQRIARAMRRLVDQAGKETKDGVEIDFPVTRQDISEMTGTTLHSVSRYLSKWEKQGIVRSQRRRVIVRRPDELPITA